MKEKKKRRRASVIVWCFVSVPCCGYLALWQDYMFKLKDTSSSGAVFFAVCRGKVCLIKSKMPSDASACMLFLWWQWVKSFSFFWRLEAGSIRGKKSLANQMLWIHPFREKNHGPGPHLKSPCLRQWSRLGIKIKTWLRLWWGLDLHSSPQPYFPTILKIF